MQCTRPLFAVLLLVVAGSLALGCRASSDRPTNGPTAPVAIAVTLTGELGETESAYRILVAVTDGAREVVIVDRFPANVRVQDVAGAIGQVLSIRMGLPEFLPVTGEGQQRMVHLPSAWSVQRVEVEPLAAHGDRASPDHLTMTAVTVPETATSGAGDARWGVAVVLYGESGETQRRYRVRVAATDGTRDATIVHHVTDGILVQDVAGAIGEELSIRMGLPDFLPVTGEGRERTVVLPSGWTVRELSIERLAAEPASHLSLRAVPARR